MTTEDSKRLKFLMYVQTAMLTAIMSILGYIVVRVDNISKEVATNTTITQIHGIRLGSVEGKVNMLELDVQRIKVLLDDLKEKHK